MNTIQKSVIHQINSLHNELEQLVKTGLDKAIKIGSLLSECKEQLPHGEFSAWIETNFRFTMRTAQNYMKLHDNREKLTGAASLTQAYRLLKSETVSFLDLMKQHLQDIINEDLTAINSFDHDEVRNKLLNPKGIDINYYNQLVEADKISKECILRIRRKLGQLQA